MARHKTRKITNGRIMLLLQRAASVAVCGDKKRRFMLGASGIRTDGVIVDSVNGFSGELIPAAHAERKLLNKLNFGSTIFVVRVGRLGFWRLAKPCKRCQLSLKNHGITRIYFSTGKNFEYEKMIL